MNFLSERANFEISYNQLKALIMINSTQKEAQMETINESILAAIDNEQHQLHESSTVRRSAENKRPSGATEWTFADWFGEDLTGKTYEGEIFAHNAGITSLKGAPKTVVGGVFLAGNELASLEFGPSTVRGDYYIVDGNKLTSLEGAPKNFEGRFSAKNNRLTSLKGAPKKCKSFSISYNPELASLSGGPEEVENEYAAAYCGLTSLEGAPKKAFDFIVHDNKLASLKGGPTFATMFDCTDNPLESLEGLPSGIKKKNVDADPELRDAYFKRRK